MAISSRRGDSRCQVQWHQGFFRREYTPTGRGFGSFFGFYTGGEDHTTHVTPYGTPLGAGMPWWTPADNATYPLDGCALVDLNDDTAAHGLNHSSAGFNGTFSADVYGSRLLDILDQHDASVPLFVYAAWHVAHLPLEVPAHYTRRYDGVISDPDRRMYAAMISAVDDQVGRMVAKLKSKGMYNNSVVVLVTDNGGPICIGMAPARSKSEGCHSNCGSNNFPLRGSKMTDFSGGTRGVAMISSPLLPASIRNTSWGGMSHGTDLYVTLAKLAGVSDEALAASGPVPPDGLNLWPALVEGGASPRTEAVVNIDGDNPGAIRVGRYKLMVGAQPSSEYHNGGYNSFSGWVAPPEMGGNVTPGPPRQICADRPCLFDLEADPFEQRDLADKLPATAAQLLQRYQELRESEVTKEAAGLCPLPDAPDGCEANRASGVWKPWVSGVQTP